MPREIRLEDERERLTRPAHAQSRDQQEHQDREEHRQEPSRDALNALLHAEVDDSHSGHAKAKGQGQLQP
jgi:hypothetical protein